MKKLTKVLSVVLAVLMVAGCFSVVGFAEDDPYACLKEGTGYVAIGDSFTRGYGAGDDWQDHIYLNDTYGNFECRNVAASYPNLVADEFGLATPEDIRDTSGKMWPLCHDAVSTAYILDLLGIDDGFRDEEFTYHYSYMTKRYETDLRYYGDPESLTLDGTAKYGQTGEIMSVREMINNASLITIGLGQTDVIYKAQLFGLNVLDMSDIASLPSGIAHIVELLTEYMEYWKSAYPLLLDYIKENNPDAKVVLVGTLNPLKDAMLTDDISIRIGSIINGIMDSINVFTQQCALEYGYMYVDISDVETPTTLTHNSIGTILSITDDIEYALIAHPTTKGYAQIAERVIDEVKESIEDEDSSDFLTGIKAYFKAIITFFKVIFSRISDLFS